MRLTLVVSRLVHVGSFTAPLLFLCGIAFHCLDVPHSLHQLVEQEFLPVCVAMTHSTQFLSWGHRAGFWPLCSLGRIFRSIVTHCDVSGSYQAIFQRCHTTLSSYSQVLEFQFPYVRMGIDFLFYYYHPIGYEGLSHWVCLAIPRLSLMIDIDVTVSILQ